MYSPHAKHIVLFVGAGFSFSAGLPLTKDLFFEVPYSSSSRQSAIFEQVKQAWQIHGEKQGKEPAQWISEVYRDRDNLPTFIHGVSWENVLDFILARLAPIPKGGNTSYYYGISVSVESHVHREFWSKIRKAYSIKSVITTNYDILIEQGLKHTYSIKRKAPICYYGGFPYEQNIRIMTNVVKREYREEKLGQEIELIKLHGSLNWVREPHGYKIHDDLRAVSRKSHKLGKPRIVPPLEEPEQPEWSYDIWNCARAALTENNTWFICGYSFPEYDIAINNLVALCALKHNPLNIIIADPHANSIVDRLKKILPKYTTYTLAPGLPELNTHHVLQC